MAELSPEAFKLKRELAELGMAVAKARGELSGLQALREEKVREAEKAASETVEAVVSASRKTLEESSALMEGVRSCSAELSSYADEVRGWKDQCDGDMEAEAEKYVGLKNTIEHSLKEIEGMRAKASEERLACASMLKELGLERKRLEKWNRRLDAKEETLKAVESIVNRN